MGYEQEVLVLNSLGGVVYAEGDAIGTWLSTVLADVDTGEELG
jgi:hypothetical protein